MKKLGYILPSLTILIILFSCEQSINIELPEYESKLVVYSILEEDSTVKVYLTESRPYFEYLDQQNQFSFIKKNANVTLTTNAGSEVLQLDSAMQRGTWFNPIVGGTTDSFYTYFFESSQTGAIGTGYTVNAEYNNKVAIGETTIPSAVSVDSGVVATEIIDFGFGDIDTQQILKFYFEDPIGEGDSYFIEYSVEGWVYNFDFFTMQIIDSFYSTTGFSSYDFETDDNRDGQNISIRSGIALWEYRHPNEKRTLEVTASMIRTNKAVSEFYQSLDQQQNSNGDPFTEPSNVVSNVTGGLGLVGGKVTSTPFTTQIVIDPIFE